MSSKYETWVISKLISPVNKIWKNEFYFLGNRSVTASNMLWKKGFNPLYNLKGGIKDWVNKGHSIQNRQ